MLTVIGKGKKSIEFLCLDQSLADKYPVDINRSVISETVEQIDG